MVTTTTEKPMRTAKPRSDRHPEMTSSDRPTSGQTIPPGGQSTARPTRERRSDRRQQYPHQRPAHRGALIAVLCYVLVILVGAAVLGFEAMK